MAMTMTQRALGDCVLRDAERHWRRAGYQRYCCSFRCYFFGRLCQSGSIAGCH